MTETKRKIFSALDQPLTRREICDETGIKWTTAFDNLDKMEREGFISKTIDKSGKPGRPKTIWVRK